MDYCALYRSYNLLDSRIQLANLLNAFDQRTTFEDATRLELVKKINALLLRNHHGEANLKYRLAKEFIDKKYIGAFEVKANSSRSDFVIINGTTQSFEIKSKFDTLNRLSKQTADYGDVFEFNTLVIDQSHLSKVEELIPSYYGIWYFEKAKKVIHRKPALSPQINPKAQLKLFTLKELEKAFSTRNMDDILVSVNAKAINEALKDTLRARYAKRWRFVQQHWSQILPIDVQFFFNSNVKPSIIYKG